MIFFVIKKQKNCSMIDKNGKLIYTDRENIGISNIQNLSNHINKLLM